jgi:hypothetical protein
MESKREQAPPIPDFTRVYRVPLESISTLGQRLADARQKGDPVALALIATEMRVAETVSGRMAEVTADEVTKEAITLGKMRRQEKELMALAVLAKDPTQAEQLDALAKTAKVEEAERISKFKSGEREKGFHYLIVNNTTDVPVSVRANGHHIGFVPGFSVREFWTPGLEHNPQTFISAHDQFGDVWKTHVVEGEHLKYTWTLIP